MPQKRVGAVCQGVSAREEWTKERKIHTNILELKTAKLAFKINEKESNSLSDRQHGSSIISIKNGATENKKLLNFIRGI